MPADKLARKGSGNLFAHARHWPSCGRAKPLARVVAPVVTSMHQVVPDAPSTARCRLARVAACEHGDDTSGSYGPFITVPGSRASRVGGKVGGSSKVEPKRGE